MTKVLLAEEAVRDLLKEIHEDRLRDLDVPFGFELEDVTVEERPHIIIAPALPEWSIRAKLSVPVIYNRNPSDISGRISLPACRDNLDKLHSRIADRAYHAPMGRLRLRSWEVSPDEAPAPYFPDGKPNGPPAQWSVTATFKVF
jgi:hypothetical protein